MRMVTYTIAKHVQGTGTHSPDTSLPSTFPSQSVFHVACVNENDWEGVPVRGHGDALLPNPSHSYPEAASNIQKPGVNRNRNLFFLSLCSHFALTYSQLYHYSCLTLRVYTSLSLHSSALFHRCQQPACPRILPSPLKASSSAPFQPTISTPESPPILSPSTATR